MSIVTRGLTQPVALLNSFGLGRGVSVLVIIGVDQVTETITILQAAGIAEPDFQIVVVDAQDVELAIVVAEDPDGALDEYLLEHSVDLLLQRVEAVDRLIEIDVRTILMSATAGSLLQAAGVTEIEIQTSVADVMMMAVSVEGAIEETLLDLEESIDKAGTP